MEGRELCQRAYHQVGCWKSPNAAWACYVENGHT